jgi:hypothetical protein
MQLVLEFSDIIDDPRCKIAVNHRELYAGPVQPRFSFDLPEVSQDTVELKITHYDKKPEDTQVTDGQITRDRSFTLSRIVVDSYDLEELIWHSYFESVDKQIYQSCLFFGPNGDFLIRFTVPVLKWILSTRHDKNNNDTNWAEDYEHYVNACQLLAQISNK